MGRSITPFRAARSTTYAITGIAPKGPSASTVKVYSCGASSLIRLKPWPSGQVYVRPGGSEGMPRASSYPLWPPAPRAVRSALLGLTTVHCGAVDFPQTVLGD